MNKREIEIAILQQLKANDSPIKRMMLRRDMKTNNSWSKYYGRAVFNIKAIHIAFLIEVIEEDRDDTLFDFTFIDDCESVECDFYKIIELDEAVGSFGIETIEFIDSDIVFYINPVLVLFEDNIFKNHQEESIYKLIYNVKTRKFDIDSDKVMRLIEKWEYLRSRNLYIYVDYRFNKSQIMDMDRSLKKSKITWFEGNRLMKVFDKSSAPTQCSYMASIAKELLAYSIEVNK